MSVKEEDTNGANSPSQAVVSEPFSLKTHWGIIALMVVVLVLRFAPQINAWFQGH
jgi:hypothetical protein